MKKFLACLLASAWIGTALGGAVESPRPLDPSTLDKPGAWKFFHVVPRIDQRDGTPVVHLQSLVDSANGNVGLALPGGVEFGTGTIELELKGRNVRGRSFLGIAFNVVDERAFEAVYFRPFNFKADDPFRERAVQYVSWPANTWERLRKDHPKVFENAVNPVPDPDGWFRARIEVTTMQVRVFVNNASTPSLTVNRLPTDKKIRPIGLFVDTGDGFFADVRVTPGRE